jgi:hypothetical protein
MGLLALKQAHSILGENTEQVEICSQAQCGFLQDHLGRWIGLFAQGLAAAASAGGSTDEGRFQDRPYLWLARFAADFVKADAARLGVTLTAVPLRSVAPTPLAPELSCGTCPINQ